MKETSIEWMEKDSTSIKGQRCGTCYFLRNVDRELRPECHFDPPTVLLRENVTLTGFEAVAHWPTIRPED